MPVAAAPRFALEAGFLILLAVVLGFADLDPVLIIVFMGLGWVLVSLIEYLAWRQRPRFPARFATTMEPEPPAGEEVAVSQAPPPPPQAASVADEQTAVTPAPAAPAENEEAPRAALQFEQEHRAHHRLQPLQPRPRRRWIVFGPRERPGEQPGSPEEGS